MKNLIIGQGEVGTALYQIFAKHHETYIRDLQPFKCPDVEILHIAYPYFDAFELSVEEYQAMYKPRLTIIHSSVPVGTTEKCEDHVVHSPVRGRHPNLATEMLAYPKYIGGSNEEDVDLADQFLSKCGWETSTGWRSEETEMIKLLSNVHLGLEIAWRQEVRRLMPEGAEIYKRWELDYFEGYKKLGQEHLIRPRLQADPIGGHCILECVKLLNEPFVSEFIHRANEKAKERQYAGTSASTR